MKLIGFLLLFAIGTGICTAAEDSPRVPDGGVCFRIDDNQTPEKWRDIVEIFNRHHKKLCASLNIGRLNAPFIAMVKRLQSEGHEVMDHTPLHRMMVFLAAPGKTGNDYRQLPGVDHINGNAVYLSYVLPTLEQCSITFKAKVKQDKLILNDRPGTDFSTRFRYAAVVCIPAEKRVFQFIRTQEDREFQLRSLWGENNVKEAEREVSVCFLDVRSFSMTPEALELLGRNSLDHFAAIGARRPYSWIQPAGGVCVISSATARSVFGERLGYKSAATYIDGAKKVYYEYNPQKNCAYGMMWADFDEENHDLQWNKTRIANLAALHHVAFGLSHMNPKDGWDKYLLRLDQLLSWCTATGIRVHTQAEWAEILYPPKPRSVSSKFEVFPLMTVDRDSNGCPDGYLFINGTWDSSLSQIVSRRSGTIFQVKNLGGLLGGKNRLTFIAEMAKPGTLKVSLNFPETDQSGLEKTFSVTPGLKKHCEWDFSIPPNVSIADFSWQLPKAVECRISSISLRQQSTSTRLP